ncbi:MAG: hypothetical protein AABY22_28115, partial [Nanoarchaeota archaeon]
MPTLIENLKQNIEREKSIGIEIAGLYNRLEMIEHDVAFGKLIDMREKKMLEMALNSLLEQIKILNNAIPDIISKMSFY